MSHSDQQVRGNLSRPMTPEVNCEKQRQPKLPLQLSSPASTKKISGVSPIVIQSKEGPQILALLKNINSNFQTLDTEVTDQNQKLDNILQRLTKLEATVKESETSNDGFIRPSSIPFKTHEEILKYDKATTKKREEMKNYLLFYNMRNNPKDNVRDILQKNRLMTDKLLTEIIWAGKNGQKTDKLSVKPTRIIFDLCS
ncbi:uncharacterized protein LOC141529536 isoform X1 [Cotesia typhae]|uniref:uncharacterized protein LOC141529536 isoform X1 n=2 Tax=Cotesia typhae TaxID=2053667 RepID=UPI003D6978AD